MKETSVAIDVFGGYHKIAVAPSGINGEIIEESLCAEKADRGQFLTWISSSLNKNGLSIHDVSRWTIGTGPGSFSALRVLSATILGLTFKKDNVKTRGLPSPAAFSEFFEDNTSSFAVLYEVMKNLAVLCEIRKEGMNCSLRGFFPGKNVQELIPNVKKPESAIIFLPAKDGQGGHYSQESENGIRIVREYPLRRLIFLNPDSWERESAKELVYARPSAMIPEKK
jgi:hypothetical protein